MPSPLGHALAGCAAGWAVAGPLAAGPTTWPTLWRTGAAFALLATMPDLDLLTPAHRASTHSVGAAFIMGLAILSLTRRVRLAAAGAAAYATHPLLDALGADTSAPVGVMAGWPLSTEYYHSGVALFESIWRRYETPDFWSHNILAVARELAILLPPALLLAWWRVRADRRRVQYL